MNGCGALSLGLLEGLRLLHPLLCKHPLCEVLTLDEFLQQVPLLRHQLSPLLGALLELCNAVLEGGVFRGATDAPNGTLAPDEQLHAEGDAQHGAEDDGGLEQPEEVRVHSGSLNSHLTLR